MNELFDRRPLIEPFVHSLLAREEDRDRYCWSTKANDGYSGESTTEQRQAMAPRPATCEKDTQSQASRNHDASTTTDAAHTISTHESSAQVGAIETSEESAQVHLCGSFPDPLEESDVYQHYWPNVGDFKRSIDSEGPVFSLKDKDLAAEVVCRIPFIEAQVRREKARLFHLKECCGRTDIFAQWREGCLTIARALQNARPARSVILKRIVDLIDLVPCPRTRQVLEQALETYNDVAATQAEIVADEDREREGIYSESVRQFALLEQRYAKFESTKYNLLEAALQRQRSIITKLLNRLAHNTANCKKGRVRFSEETFAREESEALELLCPWIDTWEERYDDDIARWDRVPTIDDLLEDPQIKKMHDDAMRKVEDRQLREFDVYGDTPVIDWGEEVDDVEDEIDMMLGATRDGVGEGPVSSAQVDFYNASMNALRRQQRHREESHAVRQSRVQARPTPSDEIAGEESRTNINAVARPREADYPAPMLLRLHFLQLVHAKYGPESDEAKTAHIIVRFDDKTIFNGTTPNVNNMKREMGAAPSTVLNLLTQLPLNDQQYLVPVTKLLNELNFEATYYQVLQLACGVKNKLYQVLLQSEKQVTKKGVTSMPVTVFGKLVSSMKDKESRVVRPSTRRAATPIGAAPVIQGSDRNLLLTARGGTLSSDIVTEIPQTATVTAAFFSSVEETGKVSLAKTRNSCSQTHESLAASGRTKDIAAQVEEEPIAAPQDAVKKKRRSKKPQKHKEESAKGEENGALATTEEAMVKSLQYISIPKIAMVAVTSNGRTAEATATYLCRTLEGGDTHLTFAFPNHEGDEKRLDPGAVQVKFLTPLFGLAEATFTGMLEPAKVGSQQVKQVAHLIVNIGGARKVIPEGSKPRLTDVVFAIGQKVRIYTHVDVNGSYCEVTDDGELTGLHELGYVHSCNTRGEGASGSPIVAVGGPLSGALLGFSVLGSSAGNIMARYTTCTPTTIRGGVVREKTL